MAYPTVQAPYGLKPVNLIGGQVFAGSTRNIPIQYGYNTNIGYGDPVVIASGTITRAVIAAFAIPPSYSLSASGIAHRILYPDGMGSCVAFSSLVASVS